METDINKQLNAAIIEFYDEIRMPLNIIQGYSQMLVSGSINDQKTIYQYNVSILKECMKLIDSIDNIAKSAIE